MAFHPKANPFLGLWLSGVNSMAGAARGAWLAEAQRQQRAMLTEASRQMLAFWEGALQQPAPADRPSLPQRGATPSPAAVSAPTLPGRSAIAVPKAKPAASGNRAPSSRPTGRSAAAGKSTARKPVSAKPVAKKKSGRR